MSAAAPAHSHEPQAAIFDMDGVLIDSYRAHFESCLRVAAELGRVYTEEQFAAGFGRTTREVIAEQWQGQGEASRTTRLPGSTSARSGCFAKSSVRIFRRCREPLN